MGVNDIMMAVQYKYEEQPPLAVPLVVFEGADDNTIPRGYMKHWRKHTSGTYRHVVLPGGTHYFVSTHYQQVTREVGQESLKIQAQMRGGLLGTGHSWVARPGAGSSDDAALESNASSSTPPTDARSSSCMLAVCRAVSTVHMLMERIYNAKEDLLDAVSIDVRVPATSLLWGGFGLVTGAVILSSLWVRHGGI